MYTCAFIEVDNKTKQPVQATATAHKIGAHMVIHDTWACVSTQDGQSLAGKYRIVSENKEGKYTIIEAQKV
jgi:hypothetical protein